MNELAFVSIPEDEMPKDLADLQKTLENNGLNGAYNIADDALTLEDEEGLYEFRLTSEEDFEGSSAGIEIAGDWEDEAAVVIILQETFEDAFPSAEFSSAYDF